MSERDLQLSSFEVSAGMPLPGLRRSGYPAEFEPPEPLSALRDALRPALLRPPCLISFSGGVDSSVVLAVAADTARRDGLTMPVPITWRFPAAPLAEESVWQERVMSGLGLTDWVRLEAQEGELDFVGPVARAINKRVGLVWPPNAHLHGPLAARARGGSLLTGAGGDQLVTLWHPRWRALADAWSRRTRPTLRDLARLSLAAVPSRVRSGLERLPTSTTGAWLRPWAAERVRHAARQERATSPIRYDTYLRWLPGQRELAMQRRSLELISEAVDVIAVSPMLDRSFLWALARLGGRNGFGGRSAALRVVLGPLWPQSLDTRQRKATFDEVFWSTSSRTLAKGVSPAQLDSDVIDGRALVSEWLSPVPDIRAALPLQRLAMSVAPRDQLHDS